MSSEEYDAADGVKCPVCSSTFYNEKAGEAMATKDPEKQAHFKGLIHLREEHPEKLEESNSFPGLIPIDMEGGTE